MKVIACIEDAVVINMILDHLMVKMAPETLTRVASSAAPPGLCG